MKSTLAIIVCLVLSLQLGCAQHPSRPCCSRIGDFSLSGKPIAEADIVNKYGKGNFIIGNPGTEVESRAHIYFDPFQSLWIRFNASHHGHHGTFVVEQIFVSVVPFAKDTALPKSRFARFLTENNIRIGLKEPEVTRLMGKPLRIDDAIERDARDSRYKDEPGYGSIWGSKVFVYLPEGEDSLLMFSIHLDKGVVRSLTLSCSE